MARALPLSGTSPPFPVVNGPATQADPAVCGSVVVWSDTHNNSDIYAKQLPSGPEIQVATSQAVEAYPACDAGRVVYSSSPLGGISDVKLYDIAAQQTRDVANQPYNEWRPSISGNRVVWQAWPGPDINILGTNLATGQNFTVTDAAENQTAPVISGSTVAWEDLRSGSGESQIWWRDVATTMPQTGIPVESSISRPQLLPSLSGRRVVFQNSSKGPWNVYIGNLVFFTGTG
jgi:Tol biopolymer transport system component